MIPLISLIRISRVKDVPYQKIISSRTIHITAILKTSKSDDFHTEEKELAEAVYWLVTAYGGRVNIYEGISSSAMLLRNLYIAG